jgi:hypothetical protein
MEVLMNIFSYEILYLLDPPSFISLLEDPNLDAETKNIFIERGEPPIPNVLAELDGILINLGLVSFTMSKEDLQKPSNSSFSIESPCQEQYNNLKQAYDKAQNYPNFPRVMGGHPEERIFLNSLKAGINYVKESPVAEAKRLYDLCMTPYIREKVRKAAETAEYFKQERDKK